MSQNRTDKREQARLRLGKDFKPCAHTNKESVGSVGGGWTSSALIKRGWSVNRARKATMLAMALLIVPTALVSRAPSMWAAVLIVGVAAAAHQAWSANVYTLASDMFPSVAVGSVVGIGAFAGAMGGVVFQRITGRVLQANGSNYAPIFVVCRSTTPSSTRWPAIRKSPSTSTSRSSTCPIPC